MIYLDETMPAELQKEATRMRRAADAIENTIARAELIRAMGIENRREVFAVLPGSNFDGSRGRDFDGALWDRVETRTRRINDLTMGELKTIDAIGVARFTWFD